MGHQDIDYMSQEATLTVTKLVRLARHADVSTVHNYNGPLPWEPGGDPDSSGVLGVKGTSQILKLKKAGCTKRGLQGPCGDFRPMPPKRSRTFQGAIVPGAFNPWSRILGVLEDALWNVHDHFKALASVLM